MELLPVTNKELLLHVDKELLPVMEKALCSQFLGLFQMSYDIFIVVSLLLFQLFFMNFDCFSA